MPLDLAAARALHERDEYQPLYCATCGDMNHNPVTWPCPTARALGATGQSEWNNNTRAACQKEPRCQRGAGHPDYCGTYDDTDSRCTLNHPHPGHCTTPTDADAPTPDYIPCGNTEGKYQQQPCILAEKHWNDHVDRDGNRWGQELDA